MKRLWTQNFKVLLWKRHRFYFQLFIQNCPNFIKNFRLFHYKMRSSIPLTFTFIPSKPWANHDRLSARQSALSNTKLEAANKASSKSVERTLTISREIPGCAGRIRCRPDKCVPPARATFCCRGVDVYFPAKGPRAHKEPRSRNNFSRDRIA